LRVRVWQIIKELNEEPAVVLDICKELNLVDSQRAGRFSILTQREAELVREAVQRYRKEEREKKKAARTIRYAPGFSPEERKKKEEERRQAKTAAAKTAAPSKKPAREAARRKGVKEDRKMKEPARRLRREREAVDIAAEVQEFTGSASLPGIHRLSRGTRKRAAAAPPPTGKVEVEVPVTVRDFSQAMGVKANDIIFRLMKQGKMVNLNTLLDEETVELLAIDYDREVAIKREKAADELVSEIEEKAMERAKGDEMTRAPVVTFLGHVDHGKTSLLDYIRKTRVAAKEAGGITQHIGAYRINTGDAEITFLDTPGHEAFTALRARGAQLTDIAVLVVAADDGVMPQTVEAINHAKAAEVPIIVAINKIDKPEADPMKVKQQLMNHDLVPEEWGGSTICVNVSAVTGEGIKDLLDMLTLVAEMQELTAHPDMPARGAVIESRKDPKRGPVATVLVQDGTLHKGDIVVVGSTYCRVRSLRDWNGKTVKEAGPSWPVEILGLSDVPAPGDKFLVVDSMDQAKKIAGERAEEERKRQLQRRKRLTLEQFLKGAGTEAKELPIILKTDVEGTREVIESTLEKVSAKKARVKIVHSACGGVNVADVQLADASEAIIICFGVVAEPKARTLAEQLKVEIRTYNVIYDLIDDVKNALQGLLEPIKNEVVTGRAEIKKVFKVSKVGTVAGCIVREGTISRSDKAKLVRNSVVVYNGAIESLKRLKDDVKEVKEGFECGIKLAGFDDIKEGDQIETYRIELVYPSLDEE